MDKLPNTNLRMRKEDDKRKLGKDRQENSTEKKSGCHELNPDKT